MSIKTIGGFSLLRVEKIDEINAMFYEFKHERLGTRVGYLDIDTEGKSFAISFKTIPSDDSGVFHILEHSVLQGSERYPIKAPINELMKSSMADFLNAMTYKDKTMYPFSTRNEKDFENLFNVYIDAVFCPRLREDKSIFLSEGWHYELGEDGVDSHYNGVVLNEMRGASMDKTVIMYNELNKMLYKDSPYRFCSGGLPEKITTLSYEDYLNTYDKFYHPSNAYILFDGKLDIKKYLLILDEYLSKYEKREPIAIVNQETVSYYEPHLVAYPDNKDGENSLSIGYVVGSFNDKKKIMALRILVDYLIADNSSELKKAIFDANIAKDISANVISNMYQPMFFFTLDGIKKNSVETIVRYVDKIILDIYKKGLDEKKLLSLLEQLRFSTKEEGSGYPEGLTRIEEILDSWLYDGNPIDGLKVDEIFSDFKAEILDGSFIMYLKEMLVENTHKAVVEAYPSKDVVTKMQYDENKRVREELASLTFDEKERLKEDIVSLREWQMKVNTKEECKIIPSVGLKDINKSARRIPCVLLPDGTIYHKIQSKGIVYLRMYFDISDFSDEEMMYASFLTTMFSEVAPKDMDEEEYLIKRRSIFGSIDSFIEITNKVENRKEAKVAFCVSVSYVKEKEDDAFDILESLFNNCEYKDEKRICRELNNLSDRISNSLINNGQRYASLLAGRAVSKKSYYKELVSGFSFAAFIKGFGKRSMQSGKQFTKNLNKVADAIFRNDNVVVSVTSKDEPSAYADTIRGILKKENNRKEKGYCVTEKNEDIKSCNYGIAINASVGYAAKSFLADSLGISKLGSFKVFSKIATMDYLWNEIRVKNGAYGTGLSVSIDGLVNFYSYRDPNPEESIRSFDNMAKNMVLRMNCEEDLERNIVSTVSSMEPLLSVRDKGAISDEWLFEGISDVFRDNLRKEILDTKVDDIESILSCFEIVKDMAFALVCDEDKLRKEDSLCTIVSL